MFYSNGGAHPRNHFYQSNRLAHSFHFVFIGTLYADLISGDQMGRYLAFYAKSVISWNVVICGSINDTVDWILKRRLYSKLNLVLCAAFVNNRILGYTVNIFFHFDFFFSQ